MREFLDAWGDPQMRHAMVVHFPIVLSLVGLPFALLAALCHSKDRARPIRWVTLIAYLMLAVSLYVAQESGDEAEHAVGSLSETGHEELEEHEEHGLNLWWWPAAICVVAGVGFVHRPSVRITSAWLVVVAGALVAQRVAHTAVHGGRLVYEHGAAGTSDIVSLLETSGAAEDDVDPRLAHFREQVRPILVGSCLRCHNPARKKRAGGLDQSTMAGLLTGGYSGAAIVPGRPDESLLITAVRWEDPDLQMPMSEDKLPDENIAALEKWIADGAVWEAFTFTPPAQD